MDNSNRYFYLSGFLSLSLFVLFLFAFISMMFSVARTKNYGYKKENYISVSVAVTQNRHVSKKKTAFTPPKSVHKQIAKSVNVKNLFSDVWAKKIDNSVKKLENKRRIEEIQKKINTITKNNEKSILKKLSSLQVNDKTFDKKATSVAEEVNEYLAKIQDIVYKHFNVPPNTQGSSVKTVIELDPFGKLLDFRVLNYSNNEALNQEADKMKERLKNVIFPVNPTNTSSKTIVILISKE